MIGAGCPAWIHRYFLFHKLSFAILPRANRPGRPVGGRRAGGPVVRGLCGQLADGRDHRGSENSPVIRSLERQPLSSAPSVTT